MRATTEKMFMAEVIRYAMLCGYRVYHTHDSRGSVAGFPDLVLIHAVKGKICVVELKTGRGKLTRSQRLWLADFAAVRVPAYVWRPENWDEIETVLGG